MSELAKDYSRMLIEVHLGTKHRKGGRMHGLNDVAPA